MTMILNLIRFPVDMVRGIYKVDGVDGRMPDRMRMLEAGACAIAFAAIAPHVVVSDMFRSAESSLEAMKRKRGVQPPSKSHHNYGRAIDLDVKATIARMRETGQTEGKSGKRDVDMFMSLAGWYCFRGDHKTGRSASHPYDESWHYDFLGDLPPEARPRYPYRNDREIAWAACRARYASSWERLLRALADGPVTGRDAARACQEMLAAHGFYRGALDGLVGPQTRAAIGALQRAWSLKETSKLDRETVQILTYVTAERRITDMVEAPAPADAN